MLFGQMSFDEMEWSYFEYFAMGNYYKTLQLRNVRWMDRFCNKLVPHIIEHKHTNYCDKHISIPHNSYFVHDKSVMFYSTCPRPDYY